MSVRTEKLKKGIHYKSGIARTFRSSGEFKCEMLPEPELRPEIRICIERMRLITQSYRATEGEPMAIRRAKALAHILDNMTVYIEEDELIIGNFASTSASLPFFPEFSHRWMDRALNNGYSDRMSGEEKAEYMELIQYWEGKSVADQILPAIPRDLMTYTFYNGVNDTSHFGGGQADEMGNFEKILKIGLKGILKEIEERLGTVDVRDHGMTVDDYIGQKENLEAMRIAVEAGCRFGKRYAEVAENMASKETDPGKKKEMRNLASICRTVPENPANTLHEALQSYFLSNLISKAIECQGQGLGDRLDQLFNPYYQKDRAEGRITEEEAQELIECLFIKFAERGHLQAPEGVGLYAGISDVKDFTIGGITPDGEDATNDFSFIVLNAAKSLTLPEPTVALRYHPKISPELISKAIDVIRTGIGHPAFYNDQAIIPFLTGTGLSLEDARNYGITACVAVSIPGKNIRHSKANAGFISFGKCMELALYQGRDKGTYTGKQLGARTPDPRTFTSIEEMMDAFIAQVKFFAEKMAVIDKIGQAYYVRCMQRPFTSAMVDGCIEMGKTCTDWEYNGLTNVLMSGATNAVDSMAAIKKLVFDEKSVTMDELIKACQTNFEGKEDLRQRLMNDPPKFGNDDEEVDKLAKELHTRANGEFMKTRDYYGFPYILDGSIAGGYHFVSTACGALPDGKKDGEPFADAVISPAAGRDTKGPTAVLKSVSKVPPTYAHLFNQKFMPQYLEGDNKELFASYLKSWSDLGIYHIQFNVVDKDTLTRAQERPEDYMDLVVRVAGYSAYYVDLSAEIQNDIMRRVPQKF